MSSPYHNCETKFKNLLGGFLLVSLSWALRVKFLSPTPLTPAAFVPIYMYLISTLLTWLCWIISVAVVSLSPTVLKVSVKSVVGQELLEIGINTRLFHSDLCSFLLIIPFFASHFSSLTSLYRNSRASSSPTTGMSLKIKWDLASNTAVSCDSSVGDLLVLGQLVRPDLVSVQCFYRVTPSASKARIKCMLFGLHKTCRSWRR